MPPQLGVTNHASGKQSVTDLLCQVYVDLHECRRSLSLSRLGLLLSKFVSQAQHLLLQLTQL